jgi:hyperosmotically inducible protein
MKNVVLSFTLVLVLGLSFTVENALASDSQQKIAAADTSNARITKAVRHQLNMLPYVNAFDYMEFTVNSDDSVTLTGEVTNPVLKSDAGNVAKRVEGVARVDNQIKVLPVSPFDDRLRVRLFRTIYGFPMLEKYALGTIKPIRIIVENGHVTLMGVVDNQTDKNVAGLRANGVFGVFSVDNQLKVEKS